MNVQDATYPLIVISGPAGVGKTTVVKALLKIYPILRSSVTYTTREKRVQTTEDKIMHHVTVEEFRRLQDTNELLEWAVVHGDLYGTHRKETEALLDTNPVIFNIDVQGAEQLKKFYGNKVITIFLAPESFEQIVDHMKARGEMSEGSFQERLKSAEKELAKKDEFDYVVTNYEGKLSETIEKIQTLLSTHLEKK